MSHDQGERGEPEQPSGAKPTRAASELTEAELETVSGGGRSGETLDVSGLNVDEVAQIVMMESAKDQQDDLKAMLAEMAAANRRKK